MSARDRSPRRDRRGGGGRERKAAVAGNRIFVNNLPFEAKWQDVKDLFRKEVGEVAFVELFDDETGRPRGAGVLELASKELAKKALEKMNRFEFKGRKIVVKEDFEVERDKYGRIITDRDRERMRNRPDVGPSGGSGGGGGPINYGNTYGLSVRFLESLGIDCPLHTRVFVANLAYDVDEKKLKEVFRLAGKVVGIELTRDKEGKSRGFAVVVYDHPVEAVQAISMFHDQQLMDRRMMVRFDKVPEEEPRRDLSRLPDGLRTIGMGLGQDGAPLWDVRSSLPSAGNEGNALGLGNLAMGGGVGLGGGMPAAAAGGNQTAAALQTALATIIGMAGGNAAGNVMAGGMGGGVMDQQAQQQQMMNSGMNSSNGMGGMSGGGRGMDNGGMSDMGRGSGMSNMGSRGGMESDFSSRDLRMESSLGRLAAMEQRGSDNMDRGMGSMDRGGYGGNDRGYGGGGMGDGMGGMDRMGGGGMDRGMGGGMDRGMVGGMDRGYGGGGMGGGGMRSDKVVVKGLPLTVTWKELKDRFAHAGDIKFAEIKERGVGVVRFGSERDAERAVSMLDGQRFEGRSIMVSLL